MCIYVHVIYIYIHKMNYNAYITQSRELKPITVKYIPTKQMPTILQLADSTTTYLSTYPTEYQGRGPKGEVVVVGMV